MRFSTRRFLLLLSCGFGLLTSCGASLPSPPIELVVPTVTATPAAAVFTSTSTPTAVPESTERTLEGKSTEDAADKPRVGVDAGAVGGVDISAEVPPYNPPAPPTPSCANITAIAPSDCAVLIALYTATDGPNWQLNGEIGWFSDADPCGWIGVTCEASRVVALRLHERNLSGMLPDALGELSSLEELVVYKNNLSGPLPSALLRLQNLVSADLSNNDFSGEILNDFGRMPTLEGLNLNYNNLSGPLPVTLATAPRLGWLDISHNNLHGRIDPAFFQLGYFNYLGTALSAGGNLIVQQPPTEQPPDPPLRPTATPAVLTPTPLPLPVACANVREIDEDECDALVAVYEQMGGRDWLNADGWLATNKPCTWHGVVCNGGHVQSLLLTSNNLRGPVSPALAGLPSLDTLHLWDNVLSGSVPAFLGSMLPLRDLQLQHNGLTGTLPRELGQLKNLQTLILFDNQLSGEIPEWLGTDLTLGNLNLSNNQFIGSLPTSLTSINALHVHHNQLSGPIPAAFGDALMGSLDISHNQFRGPLPDSFSAEPLPYALNISHNQLSGPLPRLFLVKFEYEYAGNQFDDAPPKTRCDDFFDDLEQVDCSLLITLYGRTNQGGAAWAQGPSWLAGGSPCEWEGVTCTNRRVTSLDLPGAYAGSLPLGIGNLNELTYLDLSRQSAAGGTFIGGELPETFSDMRNLRVLRLNGHRFSNAVPASLGDLQQLEELSISAETPTASFPMPTLQPALGNLTNLRVLRLSGNFPTIPESYQNIQTLEWLELHGAMSGELPAWLGQLGNLHTLDLERSNYSGPLPASMLALGNLRTLKLPPLVCIPSGDDFAAWRSGIPTLIGLDTICPDLPDAPDPQPSPTPQPETISLCQTVAAIPAGECAALAALYAQRTEIGMQNWFQDQDPCTWLGIICSDDGGHIVGLFMAGDIAGPLPPEIGNLTQLGLLDVSGSQIGRLTGPLPDTLWSLQNLTALLLSDHELSGSLPAAISNLTRLQALILPRNQFNGPLPDTLGNLADLSTVVLLSNQFNGPLPSTLAQLTKVDTFYFEGTGLCVPNSAEMIAWADSVPNFSNSGNVEDSYTICN